MSLISIFENLLIGPLKLVFEIIYKFAYRFIGHPGLAIIVLSLAMNLLVLPLYRRADSMQEQARDIEAKLYKGIAHIKKTFSGDERMMMLQTYYRQNNYSPISALNGSVSLLLEIPFFMAAYQFLSNLEILEGISLGPIANLNQPDGLLVVGGIAVNLLPILMTLVNVISSAIYLKGFPLKTKVQLYAMAVFFLIFLYSSPSGLVFYWTLNNVFSLVKTIFYKLKNPKKVGNVLASAGGFAIVIFVLFFFESGTVKKKIALVLLSLLLQLPILAPVLVPKIHIQPRTPSPNPKQFFLASLFLTLLVGLVIPSTYIAASPQEYVDPTYFYNPLWYIVSAVCLSGGAFLVWMRVFYWLASPSGKEIFDKLAWTLCGVMLVNYMFFGVDLGIISALLQYENGMAFSIGQRLINLLAVGIVCVAMYLIYIKWNRTVIPVLLSISIAFMGMSCLNMVTIKKSVDRIPVSQFSDGDHTAGFSLSKTGRNVIVLMLDRAMGEYVPYLFQERPELEEQFAGFTYYANTISHGGYTNFGVPGLTGGYEYTPVEMNKRDSELLVTKHNEALKVMPVLFVENGYEVTVCDPPYANYQWVPDLSVFYEYPEIKTYITEGIFSDTQQQQTAIDKNSRNFFCFSLMKTMPLFLQPLLYNNGQYNQVASYGEESEATQDATNISQATGLYAEFMKAYDVLTNLSRMTTVSEEEKRTFLFMSNDMTHEPMLLQEPEYIPANVVDNREYDEENVGRFTVNGRTLRMESSSQMSHYQTNMAAFIQLGKWFDYMRENGVYDNTRIILVSDHGRSLEHHEDMMMNGDVKYNVERYYPLLMVKDFNSREFSTSNEFMTNADVPTLAVEDLIANAVNPFTGKPINNAEKTAHEQFVILSADWDVNDNNGNTYLPAEWASVKDNLWDKNNWTVYPYEMVMNQHTAP